MPDEELLGRWLEDELSGAEREQVEAWVAANPQWAEWRDETRAWKETLRQALPAEQEPPAVEFFDARIGRLVREDPTEEKLVEPGTSGTSRRGGWWMPVAAAAGMAFCFWAGMRMSPEGGGGTAGAMPVVYTPEQGVEASVFQSDGADAMVIVLDGVAAIPDSFEIPDRAALDRDEGSGRLVRTADEEEEPVQ